MKKSITILLILIFSSCKKNDLEIKSHQPFEIENVKKWYETKTSKAKINGEGQNIKKSLNWDNAKKGIHFNGAEMWVIPVDYDENNYQLVLNVRKSSENKILKFNNNEELKNNFAKEFLSIYVDKKGDYYSEKVITSEYSDKKNKNKFNGLIYIMDENNKFKTGLLMENGLVINSIEEVKNLKPNEITCTYLATNYFYVGGTSSNPSTNPQYSFTSYTLLSCTWDYQQGNYGSYATTLANSSSPSSSNSGYTNTINTKDIVNNLKIKSPCAHEMVEYIRNTYTLNYIINSFNQGAAFQKYIYVIEAGSTSNGQNAETSWAGAGGIKTILNQNYLNTATKLSIFRTIVHESIHAFIIASNRTYGDFNTTYPQAWQDYLSNNDTNQSHHIAMMTNWRDRIAYMLNDYDNSRNYLWYYQDLSWGGIAIPGSQYFEQFVPSQIDRDRIFTNLSNEASGIGGSKCN